MIYWGPLGILIGGAFRVFALLFSSVFLVSTANAETLDSDGDTLVSLGTRVFDLGESSPILELQVRHEFISLTDVDWIKHLTWSGPFLDRTVIHIKDQTRLYSVGDPVWMPLEDDSRFHPDPTLPPLFHLDGYAVGWSGLAEAPVRGTILLYPANDKQRFHVLCGYDRADPGPIFCSLHFRYGPDPNLLITTRIYKVTSPLNDFAEIAARVDALVKCLDVTDAVRSGNENVVAVDVLPEDISAGGRCRALLMS